MKQLIIGMTCLLMTLTVTTHAQNNEQFTGSLLWKVSGKDISKPSYILGSHHLADIALLEKINGFKEAFDSSNVIIGELDLGNKEELQQLVQSQIMIGAKDKGYRDLLSEQEYAKLDQDLQQFLGAQLTAVENFKPMMLNAMLAIKIYTEIMPSVNLETHISIDEHVQITGSAKNKKIIGLESAQDQIDALYGTPIADQLQDLLCTLSEMETAKDTALKLNEYYESAQLAAMYNLALNEDESATSACPLSKENKHALLDNRNNNWLKKLPELLKENSNLIAVGALHLAGDEGLLNQLSQMGYKVEAVK